LEALDWEALDWEDLDWELLELLPKEKPAPKEE